MYRSNGTWLLTDDEMYDLASYTKASKAYYLGKGEYDKADAAAAISKRVFEILSENDFTPYKN